MHFGFDRPLYLLPFDHRESFKTRVFGWHGSLTEDQAMQIAAVKQVIYEGFTAALAGGAPKEKAQDEGVEPDVWKVEGLDRLEDCEKVVARRGGRTAVGCIILGRGADEKKVTRWLETASQVSGFIGFAVGRTVFWEALTNFRAKKITHDQAVANIARRYADFLEIFESRRIRAA